MILFLDFDGVTHPRGADINHIFSAMPLIWKMLREHNEIDVVFSTSWRENYGFEDLIEICTADGGEDLRHRFIGMTPNIKFARRDLECKAWLDKHNPFDTWIALDDDPNLYLDQTSLYVVDSTKGLVDEDIINIQNRLYLLNNTYVLDI